ncbi:MAG: ribonuclease R [Clostridiales bacterium]|jgi:ribonuclease R|nr:ribonuclease R [Clostridiales bacterium]
MEFKTKLYEEIKRAKIRGFTERQLFVRLNSHTAADKKAVKAALDELVAEGFFIVGADKKYFTPKEIGAVRGTLQGNRRGFAFLIPDESGTDIFIPHHALNGAMHKDKVYATVKKVKDENGRREGEVVSILERGVKNVVGTIRRFEGGAFVIPDDPDFFCDVIVHSKKIRGALNGQKVVARITNYAGGKNPEGEVAEVLGDAGNPATDLIAIVKSFGFEDEFEKAVIKEAKTVAGAPISLEGRTDLRETVTITIDGDDAKDLDDAISLTKSGECYKLCVHIADVAHYVRHKSMLDNEAFKRGTSVYFPGSVIPMLPEELSNGVCSLNENVDRPALSVEMLIDREGKILGHKIFESVIRSDARMTYKNVTKILEGDAELCERYFEIVPMIKDMYELSKILYDKREKRGAVFFVTKESVVDLDEKGAVRDIRPYEYGVSNAVIEEFMLAANETVAEFVSHTGYPFIYRIHEKPSMEKMEIFERFMSGIGLKFSAGEGVAPQDIQNCLNLVKNTDYGGLINTILLRSMQKARYDVKNKGHFGLAAKYYCHFTSPIRRYPDLVIHRIIKMMLKGGFDDKSNKKMTAFCAQAAVQSSEREKSAETAERRCDDYCKAFYMEDKIGEVYRGVISSVTSFGIFVELLNTVEGLVRAEDLPSDNYVFDEKKYMIYGKNHKFELGSKVTVRVESADRTARQVLFKIVEEE